MRRALSIPTLSFAVTSACGSSAKVGLPCANDAECGSGNVCVYKIEEGCAAMPTCQALPTGTQCGGAILYCACSGVEIGVGCGSPDGYAGLPVTGPKQHPTCRASDAGADSSGLAEQRAVGYIVTHCRLLPGQHPIESTL